MKSNVSGASGNLWAVGAGTIATMALSLGMAAAAAALIEKGLLPASSVSPVSWGITALAALLGGLICAGKAGGKRLPLCLAACALYLLIVFVLRGLLFGGVGAKPWIIPICAFGGAVVSALISSKKKRR